MVTDHAPGSAVQRAHLRGEISCGPPMSFGYSHCDTVHRLTDSKEN